MASLSYFDANLRPIPFVSEVVRSNDTDNSSKIALSALASAVGALDIIAVAEKARTAAPELIYIGDHCIDAGFTAETILPVFYRERSKNAPVTRWIDSIDHELGYELLAAAIHGQYGEKFAVGLLMPQSDDAVRECIVEAFEKYASLFGPVLSLCVKVSQTQKEVLGCRTTLDRCDSAIVLLNNEGEIVLENRQARRLLTAGKGLQRRGSTVVATELSDAVKLRVAVDHVLAGGERSGLVLAIRGPGGVPRLLVSVVSASASEFEARDVFAVMFICDPTRVSTNLLSAVCRLYGLSPVETALACQIVSGVSLGEAAQALRIKELTARSYLKQIFAKTGVNCQAAFVRLMLSSTVGAQNESAYTVL